MLPALGPPGVSLGHVSRKDCVIFTFIVSWPLAIGEEMTRVVNVGKEKGHQDGVGWRSWSKDEARPNRAARVGRNNASQISSALHFASRTIQSSRCQ